MNARLPLHLLLCGALGLLFGACNTPTKPNTPDAGTPPDTTAAAPKVAYKAPIFNKDSAYHYTKVQVDFGPRIPNSTAHERTAKYIIAALNRYKAKVYTQTPVLTGWDGKKLKCTNIIAAYNPAAKDRIALFAHWDTRPIADQDSVRPKDPIDGANDGASGVGVLLEIARKLSDSLPAVGVDLIFLDLEDYGTSGKEDSYCLGTQYWCKTPHVAGYQARFGVLLDMVGAPGATFPMEGTSHKYAAAVQEQLWGLASSIGMGRYFAYVQTGELIDDHYFINQMTKIPTVDIIHFDLTKSNFPFYWHTHKDDMQVVSAETLGAVGQLLMEALWREQAGAATMPAATPATPAQ